MIFKKKTKKLLQIGLTLQKSLTFFEEIPKNIIKYSRFLLLDVSGNVVLIKTERHPRKSSY